MSEARRAPARRRSAGTASGAAEAHTPLAPWRQITARVSSHEDRGAGHRWLELEVPAPFARPLPGQFVQLLLAPEASGALLPRPMSVAGVTAHRRGWRVGFLYAPVGLGTLALSRLAMEDTVDVLGPLGRGYPLHEPGTPVLVAGGRGVAPLLLAAEALAASGKSARFALGAGAFAHRRARERSGRRCEFLFGARSESHLIGLADAKRRLARNGGRLHLCTDDGSRGMRGNVVQLLERVMPGLAAPIVIHACGPHGMLRAVAEWAIARDLRAYLAMESVMACGTGVCRGCPLPRSDAARAGFAPGTPSLYGNAEFAMCCTEGPVFEARELDWERVA